ncbi:hypothetical protein [Roseibium sp. RKSG952]|uniref:hypothetical protein n=1 Tax=Roseibium sp. RKSG952 TaxID=2529384 RepID=UPI0012BB5667|nr:hypothetical protein [Roseibium sp. RKSG952]MTH99794.1 hypothetical protein [Roseibium sp. RKSG952]
MPINRNSDLFYPDLEFRAKRLSSFLKDSPIEADIVFFIRDYAGFLRSSYIQYIRQGGTETIGTFIGQLSHDTINWTHVAGILETYFPGRVRIVAYEDFFSAPARNLARTFFDGCLSEADCTGLEAIRVNRSPALAITRVARATNAAFQERWKMTPREAGRLTSKLVIRPFEGWLRFGGKSGLNPDLLETLNSRYQEDVKNLCRQ